MTTYIRPTATPFAAIIAIVAGIFIGAPRPVAAQTVTQAAAQALRAGDHDRAIVLLTSSNTTLPADLESALVLSVAHMSKGDLDHTARALSHARTLASSPQDSDRLARVDAQLQRLLRRREAARAIAASIANREFASDGVDKLIVKHAGDLSRPDFVAAYVAALMGNVGAVDWALTEGRQMSAAELVSAWDNPVKMKAVAYDGVFKAPRPEQALNLDPAAASLRTQLLARVAQGRSSFLRGSAAIQASITEWTGPKAVWGEFPPDAFHSIQRLVVACDRSKGAERPACQELLQEFWSVALSTGSAAPFSYAAESMLVTASIQFESRETVIRLVDKLRSGREFVSFFTERLHKNGRVMGEVQLDFKEKVLSYTPVLSSTFDGKSLPPELLATQSYSFDSIREIAQPKKSYENKNGYRIIDAFADGVDLGDGRRIPRPMGMQMLGTAFGELPQRQAMRSYGAMLAHLLGVPESDVELIPERPGTKGLLFASLIAGGMSGLSTATGQTAMASLWADQATQFASIASAQNQQSFENRAAWTAATEREPLFVKAFDLNEVTDDLNLLVGAVVGDAPARSASR